MKPKVLKTEPEYTAALARVESLMDARPGNFQVAGSGHAGQYLSHESANEKQNRAR